MSLEGCPHNPPLFEKCIKWFTMAGKKLIGFGLISGMMLGILTILIIFRRVHVFWVIPLIINPIILFKMDEDNTPVHHGFFNRLFVILFYSITIVLFFLTLTIVYMCRKGWPTRLVLIGIVLFFAIYYYSLTINSCDKWEYGLGKNKIDNNIGECKIVNPDYCELEERTGFLDFSKFAKSCPNQPQKVIFTHLSPELKRREKDIKTIGFPRTEKIRYQYKVAHKSYQDYIQKHVIDMDDENEPDEIKDSVEYTIERKHGDASDVLHINVKRNETRSQELKKIRAEVLQKDKLEGNTDRIDYNMVVFYLDHVSRSNFRRKLKKLTAWLDQFAEENTNTDVLATSFLRYHGLKDNSPKNNNAMFYGEHGHLNKDESNNIYSAFSRNGFITGRFQDECDYENLEYENKYDRPQFYEFDHDGSPISCDSNYDIGSNHNIVLGQGRYSQYIRCLYGKMVHTVGFEYLIKFWEAYPDNKKFFKIILNDAHEPTGAVLDHADEGYLNFFKEFYAKGFMKDTQIVIIADHGAHFYTMRTPMFPDNSRRIENAFPVHILLVPRDIPEKPKRFIRENQQRFATHHDFYTTYRSFAEGKITKTPGISSYSLMHEELPKGRDCTTVLCPTCEEVSFDLHWCFMDYSIVQAQKDKSPLYGFDAV